MPDTGNLSEAKRALLQKYLQGNLARSAPEAPIPRRTSEGPAPLAFAQEQVWLHSHLTSVPIYNDCLSLHIAGPLDVAALEQSVNEVLRRHDILRTSFPLVEGKPVQLVHPPARLQLPITDLRSFPAAEREAEGLRRGREEVRQLFDLEQGPLVRFRLIRLDEEEHRLFIIVQHLLGDGVAWYHALLPEIGICYEAFAKGQPSPLPELSLQYADYATWQREQLQEEALAGHLAYWKQQLSGAPQVLELPSDRPHPPRPSYRGGLKVFALPRSLTAALKDLSHREGTTLFITLMAAFNALVYRYTEREDLVVGTVTGGRRHPAIQKMLGCTLNPLVLRTDLAGNPSFRELLKRTRDVITAALEHDELPFPYLVKKLPTERATEQNPFYQVMMVLEPLLPPLPAGWGMSQMEVTAGTAKVDLYLEMDDRPDEGIIGRFEYSTDLFDADTIERMYGHWQTLLEGIVADPTQSIAALPLLTQAERQHILSDWNATQVAYPLEQSIHQIIEAQVERTPQATALVFEGQELTYRELNQRANQLAHHLQQLGVGPETLVGISAKRSLEMVVGLLGILKAGGAYVPLDPTYPQERLAIMLADAQVPVLLTQAHLVAKLPASQARLVCLDADWEKIAQEESANPVSGVTPANLAYVIYTSGSTGKPKGVMNTHRGLCNRLLWMQDAYHLTQADRVLQKTPYSFDVSVWEFFWPLMTGARLVVARPEGHKDPAYLRAIIAEQQITTLHFVPSMLQVFLEGPGLEQCSSLRQVMCSGEALPFELQERYFSRFAAPLYNLYGPTEAAIDVTSWACTQESTRQIVPIGRPIANTQIYLLDAQLQPVPVGVPGELHIGGIGLARGYLNRPELTRDRFISNPFSADPDSRLYKTGDLARFLPTGEIEYLGRIDFQVKIRGFRIELGEIEATLLQHPQVQEAVVTALEWEGGEKRLVAYLVLDDAKAPTSATLRAFLQAQLPDYMIPSAFVPLAALPLSSNGKVDRRALPRPEETSLPSGADFVAPRTPTEEQLATIWADLLGLKQIGVTQNLFDLGGHSLLAVRALTRVQERFHVDLPFSVLFEAPTIAELAVKLVQYQAEQVDDTLLAQLLAQLEQTPENDLQDALSLERQPNPKGVPDV